MKFNMVRKMLDRTREQVSDKRNDQRIVHKTHVDYIYLTNIPASVGFDDIDDAFDCFAFEVCANIEYFTSISSYFSDVHTVLDDTKKFWTFRFRFDEYKLEEEYEIET